jgi:hypothetical protein
MSVTDSFRLRNERNPQDKPVPSFRKDYECPPVVQLGQGRILCRAIGRKREDSSSTYPWVDEAGQRPVADYRSLRAMWGWQWWQPFL